VGPLISWETFWPTQLKKTRQVDNMKFAHFSHVWGKPRMTPHARYEELWRELELCDDLGFDFSFCVEHHFQPHESWISSPALYAIGAGARTKRLRVGSMGFIPALYHPLRLAEEIAIIDQMLGGRFECGLVPGITAHFFTPFGSNYEYRKSPTLEYIHYLRAAYGKTQPFSFHGENFKTDHVKLAVSPAQLPHPPLWMMSRDPQTLEFCAKEGINTGSFLMVPRIEAAPRYRKFVEDWNNNNHGRKPNIGYCTVVYVDETDKKAVHNVLGRASRAYEGLLPLRSDSDSFETRLAAQIDLLKSRGEVGAAALTANLFDPEYILDNDLMFIGSPETVTRKLRNAAEEGYFNTFMGEFNFSDLSEPELMRSIALFGERVIPALRNFEPF
jgi:alkanesulfonate monooxygenase SsuD/methylene tetrahydromethanopterin reductase-like flavin-dependent oxidoreductase (luciferase family)